MIAQPARIFLLCSALLLALASFANAMYLAKVRRLPLAAMSFHRTARALDLLDGSDFGMKRKRALDYLEGTDFGMKRKRALDYLEGTDFGMKRKRALDLLDGSGFGGLSKRALDYLEGTDFGMKRKRALDYLEGTDFGMKRKRALDYLEGTDFGMKKRSTSADVNRYLQADALDELALLKRTLEEELAERRALGADQERGVLVA